MSRPRPISGTPGRRIRLILGEDGSSHLLVLDNDDGDRQWQDTYWENIPSGLGRQINNMESKGRYVTNVAFGPEDGLWFIAGRKRDGTGDHSWWGNNTCCADEIKKQCGESKFSAAFGGDDNYVLISGGNGYSCSCDTDGDLSARLKRIHRCAGKVNFLRLFPSGGYYISDSNGSEWKGLGPYLDKELKSGGSDKVLDVCEAGDGSWVVIRPTRFVSSQGIADDITKTLSKFYREQLKRQKNRDTLIQQYETKLRQEKERLEEEKRKQEEEKRERQEAERLRQEKEERKQKEAEEREQHRRRHEETTKKRRDEEERVSRIHAKHFKVGDKVSAVGLADGLDGGNIIECIDRSGVVHVRTMNGKRSSLAIYDPRLLVHNEESEEINQELRLLFVSSDEYEAAVSMYLCACHGDVCRCKKLNFVGAAALLNQGTINQYTNSTHTKLQATQWVVGDRVHVKGYADATVIPVDTSMGFSKNKIHVRYDDGSKYHVNPEQLCPPRSMAQESGEDTRGVRTGFMITREVNTHKSIDAQLVTVRPLLEHRGEVQPFDQYICAEKIDIVRLRNVIDDLMSDRHSRERIMNTIRKSCMAESYVPRKKLLEAWLKKLQRCYELEATAQELYALLKDLPASDDGCVVHEVKYQHKDPSRRGRLFAIGNMVKLETSKYPRTTTLQGMHSDLRAPLVGAFAHDIDCENSEIRLLCSLAAQLSLTHLTPTLTSYRDNRKSWLSKIATLHNVTRVEAKRLPNIILSGGVYTSWLKALEIPQLDMTSPLGREVKKFVARLVSESHALRDELIDHPRFGWTAIDRDKLKNDGKSDGAITVLLMPRIIQSCENEVLSLLHRHFHNMGWKVRAKVFDGMIAEKGPDAMKELNEVMIAAENILHSHGWDIRLVEKPLNGNQDKPLRTVVEAREAMKEYRVSCYTDPDAH